MAETTTGAQASTSGAFSGLLDKLVTSATTLYTAKAQADAAKAAAKAGTSPTSPTTPPPAADWKGTVATGSGITSKPWFPVVVIGGALLLIGGLFLALRGKRK